MANTPLNTNRLNLPNMVDNQLKDTVVPTENYFNPVFISNTLPKKKQEVPPPQPKNHPKTNIVTSVNSIVATVHTKLRNQRLRSKSEAVKTELTIQETESEANKALPAGAQTPTPTVAATTTTTKKPLSIKIPLQPPPSKAACTPFSKAKSNSEPEHKLTIAKANLANQFHVPGRANSIPQLKAIREQHSMQGMRRNIGRVEEMTEYMRRKRMNEVVQQKRVLEDMLQQHYKLQRDRQTIAVEIQTMREHLNHIRDRLDTSLKKLNTKCTVSERFPRQKNIINKFYTNRARSAAAMTKSQK